MFETNISVRRRTLDDRSQELDFSKMLFSDGLRPNRMPPIHFAATPQPDRPISPRRVHSARRGRRTRKSKRKAGTSPRVRNRSVPLPPSFDPTALPDNALLTP